MGLPEIEINFTQKAVSAIDRSERGIVVVVIRDATTATAACVSYKYQTDIPEDAYTANNMTIIKRAFLISPTKVYVLKVGESDTFSAVTTQLEK